MLFLAIQEEGRKNTNMRFWIWTTDFRDLGPLVLLTKGLLGSFSVMSDITFVCFVFFQSSERIYWLLGAGVVAEYDAKRVLMEMDVCMGKQMSMDV